MTHFDKPTVNFDQFPIINIWIEAEYCTVKNYGDLVDFLHYCFDQIEKTTNEVRIDAYKKIAYPLYSIVIGKSYESNL